MTSNDMGNPPAQAWARRLCVPSALRGALKDVEVAIILLKFRYLDVNDPPVPAPNVRRSILMAKPSESSEVAGAGVVSVPAGKSDATRSRSELVAPKGRMSERFAEAIGLRPELHGKIKADASPATFVTGLAS